MIEEITALFSHIYQRFRLDVTSKSLKVELGVLNSEADANELAINIQKIKTFLLIKDRKKLLKSIDGVESLLEDIKERF